MAMINSIKEMHRPVSQCISREIWTWQQDTKRTITPTTLTEIGWPQVSGGCPYKVVISQWVPTRPEANEQMNVIQRYNEAKTNFGVIRIQSGVRIFHKMVCQVLGGSQTLSFSNLQNTLLGQLTCCLLDRSHWKRVI